ncbi:potassium channel family protein [Chloroflexus aggregans]|uniref:Ion transport 2 domain protein n=1 Tax=Chloroflexus aggregans (strain MD-66 / DSM 9485) TaxID=326427 RepID=B8GCA7_CHLAD|nr:potassium channel family protein [Chloroflexus aggregans]ACL23081.1 Ion transport 2 domain protein [Chloroflexus aggregans DSM 9485]
MTHAQRTLLLDRFYRITEIPMLFLSICFLVIFFLIESRTLSTTTTLVLDGILWIIWGIFGIELLIKWYLSPDRVAYLRANWIEIVMIAIPFLRPLRLLWLPIILTRLWRQSRQTLRQRMPAFIGITSLIVVLVAATLMFVAEQGSGGPIASFADAIWWALTTVTTVGYGDTYPVTVLGRGVAVFLMLAGISLFGLLTANIAALFVEDEAADRQREMLTEIQQRLTRIEQLLAQRAGEEKQL